MNIKGFTIIPAQAIWVTCDECDDEELFYGQRRDDDALQWATEHFAATHQGATT